MSAVLATDPITANEATTSAITADCRFGDDQSFTLTIPIQGLVSDGVVELKRQSMAKVNEYLASHNVNPDEPDVDLMEEAAEEEDAGGDNSKQQNGKKRKKSKG